MDKRLIYCDGEYVACWFSSDMAWEVVAVPEQGEAQVVGYYRDEAALARDYPDLTNSA